MMSNYLKPRRALPAFAAAVAACVLFTGCDPSGNSLDSPDTDSSGSTSASVPGMRLGWNLGNSLDCDGAETAWGNPTVTKELLAAVKAAGFDTVRVPITWMSHLGPSPDYAIDAAWLARVTEVVGYALDAGLKVIINVHHDDVPGWGWLTLEDSSGNVTDAHNALVYAQFSALWTQIAAAFKAYDDNLMFESMNEIHVGYDAPKAAYYAIINDLNQAFVDLVRASGGNNATRYLVVPGYNTNIDYTVAGFVLPTDSATGRLIVSVHFYDPWSFAGEGATHVWGADSAGSDSWGQESGVRAQFDKLKATYVDKGIPVILGEYGAVNQTGYETYRRYYMEYVTKAAHDRLIVPIFWDNGSHGSGKESFGLINRVDNTVLYPDIMAAMVRAVTEDYALTDVDKP